MNWIDLCEYVLCWWILPCELLCHIWLSWGACHSWLCMIVIVVVVVELYADIHSLSPLHTHILLRAHALECSSFNCWGLMPWSALSFNCWGLMPCECFNHSKCWGLMPWNALSFKHVNGTTCMCIVALSLFVVVLLHSRCRWSSCCCVVVVGWIWTCW